MQSVFSGLSSEKHWNFFLRVLKSKILAKGLKKLILKNIKQNKLLLHCQRITTGTSNLSSIGQREVVQISVTRFDPENQNNNINNRLKTKLF